MRANTGISLFVLALLCAVVPAFGQNGPGGGGGGFGPGGGGGRGFGGQGGPGGGQFQFDPSQIGSLIDLQQQRQLDNIKASLGSTDEEFAVMQPSIQKIMQYQMGAQIRAIGAMLRNVPTGPNGPQLPPGMATQISQQLTNYNFGKPPSPVQLATADLQATVDDPSSTPDIINAKLAALRAARERQDEEIAAAQNDLKPMLSLRQEAVLSLSGVMP